MRAMAPFYRLGMVHVESALTEPKEPLQCTRWAPAAAHVSGALVKSAAGQQ